MAKLSDREVKLTEQLLLMIKSKEKSITYGELGNRINPPMNARGMGGCLESICILCHDLGLPLLTAMVVQKSTNLPGDGFEVMLKRFGKYDPDKTMLSLFHDEVHAIHSCGDWEKLVNHLNLDISF